MPKSIAEAAFEAAARWQGKPGELFAALVKCRWVDLHADGMAELHDWEQHNGGYIAKQKRDAERKRLERLNSVDAGGDAGTDGSLGRGARTDGTDGTDETDVTNGTASRSGDLSSKDRARAGLASALTSQEQHLASECRAIYEAHRGELEPWVSSERLDRRVLDLLAWADGHAQAVRNGDFTPLDWFESSVESASRDKWMVDNGKGIDWLAEPTNLPKAHRYALNGFQRRRRAEKRNGAMQ
jgi:hypothetical protein